MKGSSLWPRLPHPFLCCLDGFCPTYTYCAYVTMALYPNLRDLLTEVDEDLASLYNKTKLLLSLSFTTVLTTSTDYFYHSQ